VFNIMCTLAGAAIRHTDIPDIMGLEPQQGIAPHRCKASRYWNSCSNRETPDRN